MLTLKLNFRLCKILMNNSQWNLVVFICCEFLEQGFMIISDFYCQEE